LWENALSYNVEESCEKFYIRIQILANRACQRSGKQWRGLKIGCSGAGVAEIDGAEREVAERVAG